MEVKRTRILLALAATNKESVGEGQRAEFIEVKEYTHDFKKKPTFAEVFDAVADAEGYIHKDDAYQFVCDNPPEQH